MNLPPQNYQEATPDQSISPINASGCRPFPLKAFPSIIKDAIIATSIDKKVPEELAASAFLAAASLSCLPLVEAIPVHTLIPEPAVLNILTIAKSGLGKSTVLRPAMRVFHEFIAKANDEYSRLLKQYQTELALWEEERKGLARNLRQATIRNYNGGDEYAEMEAHLLHKPEQPVRFNFLHQDVSNGELLKSLSVIPEAGIISEEAVTFFKSRAKNDPGLFNLGWDGASYSYKRDGVDCYMNLRLMFCLMTQPDIFDEYISKNHSTGRGSGFLARFLMVKIDNASGHHADDYFNYAFSSTENFDNRVKELLELAKANFYGGITDKLQLTLTPQAISFMGEKRAVMQQKITEGGPWEHIADIALKSGANALRLATIFHYFSRIPGEKISLSEIENAHEIVDWYMHQAVHIFHKNSRLFQFEKDVLEIYYWIHNRMMMDGRAIIAKSEIMRCGPKHKDNNLRHAIKLEPILNQLAWQKRIQLIQNYNGGPVYIILPNSHGIFQDPGMSLDLFPNGCRWLQPEHRLEMVELILPNLTFSW